MDFKSCLGIRSHPSNDGADLLWQHFVYCVNNSLYQQPTIIVYWSQTHKLIREPPQIDMHEWLATGDSCMKKAKWPGNRYRQRFDTLTIA